LYTFDALQKVEENLLLDYVGEIETMKPKWLLKRLVSRAQRLGKTEQLAKPLEGRSEEEMLLNAFVISEIGSLDTTSPFSSRESPDLGEDNDKRTFDRLTDVLIANID